MLINRHYQHIFRYLSIKVIHYCCPSIGRIIRIGHFTLIAQHSVRGVQLYSLVTKTTILTQLYRKIRTRFPPKREKMLYIYSRFGANFTMGYVKNKIFKYFILTLSVTEATIVATNFISFFLH